MKPARWCALWFVLGCKSPSDTGADSSDPGPYRQAHAIIDEGFRFAPVEEDGPVHVRPPGH